MADSLTCPRCGGQMIDAAPVDIFCPNDACVKGDMATARAVVEMWDASRSPAAAFDRGDG